MIYDEFLVMSVILILVLQEFNSCQLKFRNQSPNRRRSMFQFNLPSNYSFSQSEAHGSDENFTTNILVKNSHFKYSYMRDDDDDGGCLLLAKTLAGGIFSTQVVKMKMIFC